LTLLKSAIRKSPRPHNTGYTREGTEDARFSDQFGDLQAIVTGTGQNDNGQFHNYPAKVGVL
jgi:hypothetical protein